MSKKPIKTTFIAGTHCYVGMRGNDVVAVVWDDPGKEKHTAATVAEFIKDGLSVQRVPGDDACDRLRQYAEKRKLLTSAQGQHE